MTTLTSLHDGYRAFVAGATGGLGRAFIKAIEADPRCGALYGASRSGEPVGTARPLRLDLTDEAAIEAAIARAGEDGPLHLVIAATGVLHSDRLSPEKTWRHLDADTLVEAYRVNAVGPALLAKHALDHLDRDRRALFAALSARVGSISDNRLGGWHGYRASKAGLNQLIRTLSIELARKSKTSLCVGLHPGTVDTELSEPFQRNVPEHKLFSPDYAVECLLGVLDTLEPGHSGRIFDWAGEEIEP